MRTILKRVLVISLVTIMLMGCFAGCGTDERPEVTMATKNADGLYTTDPVTLDIIVKRHPDREETPDYIWYFEYIEYWFGLQGYDVTINVEEINSESQVDLMLNTDTLPDIVWSVTLNNAEIVRYGVEEHMLLDWTPYLNEELMPNLCAQYANNPSMKAAETAPDGGIYGLPYITPYPYSTIPGMVNRMFVRQSWLDEVGLDMPTTEEEFLDMLRAFKSVSRTGMRTAPMISSVGFLEKYLWTCLGFYGTDGTKYGTEFMIKDGEVVLPGYSDEYRHFVELMHTMYSEGLLPNDYLTMSDEQAVARINEGSSGVHGWYTLQYVGDDYADQNLLGPIPMGGNDEVYVSRLSDYTLNTVWVSSKTKYPEVVALMMDFMYSEEGSWLYMFGPKEGEDPLGLVDGWYYDENGLITTSKVANGKYDLMEVYARDHIRPNDYAGLRVDPVTTGDGGIITYIDAVTGNEYKVINDRVMTRSSNDEWWRLETIEKWTPYATSVRLPSPYLDVDIMAEMTDIAGMVKQWISQETPKFIKGTRPLSELDQFFEELRGFGVEEYIATYREAYQTFMDSTFGG